MPHGTSPDGKKMTLVASDGKTWQVLVWNWTTMKVEAALPTNGQSLRVTLAPDGKHVAAFANLEAPGAPREHWVHLFRIDGNAREVKRWKLDAPLGHFGFTSDGDQFFFAHEAQAPAVTYSLTTGAAGQLPIAAARQRVAFSRDFERFAVWTTPNSLSIQSWANRLLGTVQGQFRGIDAAAFSADNRFLLIGMHSGQGKDAEARAALVDLNNQGVVSVTDTFVGVPDGVQLARNGIALIAGESVLPRLVRFPGVAPAPVLDAQPGPSFTLTERNPVAPQLLFQMTKDMDVVHLGPDGRRLVLTRFKTDATSYRQAPAFDMDLPLIVPGKRKYVHGSGFTPDGSKAAPISSSVRIGGLE